MTLNAHPFFDASTLGGVPDASPSSAAESGLGFWALVREDLATQGGNWTQTGFQALLMYRIGTMRPSRFRIVRSLCWRLYRVLHVLVRNVYGIELHSTTRIGRRVLFAHQGGIVVHGQAVIGDDCVIRHGVTIGAASGVRHDKAPVFGRGVEVAPGAVILGSVRIGDGVKIGPNAVVMTNVPAGAVVVAPPSRILLRGK